MQIRKCLGCEKSFYPKKRGQKFCSAVCYKKKYNQELKDSKFVYPVVVCEKCEGKTQLDFNPRKNAESKKKWMEWRCPYCRFKDGERLKNDEADWVG